MIRINCTQCQTLLEIDDAFAGGVCRCQHCGAIQTVPSRSKRDASPISSATPAATTLFQPTPRPDGRSGSGLNRLADSVPSSGSLSGTGVPQNRVKERELLPSAQSDLPEPTSDSHQLRNWVIVGSALVGMIGLMAWFGLHGGVKPPVPTAESAPPPVTDIDPVPPATGSKKSVVAAPGEVHFPEFGTAPAKADPPKLVTPAGNLLAKANEPRFYGVKIDAPTVVYVLDRNSGMGDGSFGDLRKSVYRSIDSLKPTQQFRVVVIGKKNETFVWPSTGFSGVSKDKIDALKKATDGLKTIPDKDLQPLEAFGKAFADGPAMVVFATARDGYDDRGAATWLAQGNNLGTIKIFGFNLNGSNKSSRALKKLADSTHGLYRELSVEDARAFAQGKK